jgi:glucosamine-phosphate N-acetyltransferase
MTYIRPLRQSDLTREYFTLLNQLSHYPLPSSDFAFNNEALYNFGIYQHNSNHYILVALHKDVIIGTAALLVEYKIRGLRCAHIEDVVVDSSYRGHGTGKQLIEELVKIAKSCKCYKVILDCSDTNIKFYEGCGFRKYENCMRMNLNEGIVD